MTNLERRLAACRLCETYFAHRPRPVFRLGAFAPILIVGQAPGLRVHQTGIPWNDPSGQRLRRWLDVTDDIFYDTRWFSMVPIAMCYPGRNARGADLPPPSVCMQTWKDPVLSALQQRQLTLLVGSYAQRMYLGESCGADLAQTVREHARYRPEYFPLPHPSWRNNGWFKRHPWFEIEVVNALRQRVHQLLRDHAYEGCA